MPVKVVLLFCYCVLLIKTVSSQVAGDITVTHMTEQQYNDLKGPDFCGALKNDANALKDACTKVAVREGLIQPGGSLKFTKDNPKCESAKIQLYDAQGNKTKLLDTQLLGCGNESQSFPIGRGTAANDIMMYGCPNAICESHYNMPGVY